MINFRYHIVSIVAIFLALAIGMIMGTTVIKQGVLSQLKRDASDFKARNSELRKQVDDLNFELSELQKFGSTILRPLVKGKLLGKNVTIIEQDGASSDTLNHVVEALVLAGANKPSIVRLTASWSLANDKDRANLTTVAQAQATDTPTITQSAASAIGARILAPSELSAPDDLFVKLRDSGFLTFQDLPANGPFPQSGSLIVVIPSGLSDAIPTQDAFFLTLLRAIADKRVVAVAEPMSSADSLARRVQDDPLRARVATIDHADQAPGQLSLVWALRALELTGIAEHFGTQSGSDGVAPVIAP
ncbi:MAG: copper transporter [Actinomycetota bacterium]